MSQAVSGPEVRAVLDSAVEEVTGVVLSKEPGDRRLLDLGVQSLDLIEVGMILEDRWGFRLEAEAFDGVQTVDDVVARVMAILQGHPDVD